MNLPISTSHNQLLAIAQYKLGNDSSLLQEDQKVVGKQATAQLEKIISQVIAVLSLFAVLFFIIQIILAGYKFMSSKGDEKAMEAARSQLTSSILGLTIVIIAVGVGSLIAKLAGIENVLNLEEIFTNLGL